MRADHETEFRDFVLSRRTALVRTAYLLCGDSGHAEDLVQGTLAKAYLAMVNLHVSRKRRKRVAETLSWRLPERHADTARPDAVADRGALFAALARLAPRQRAVVVLRYWEDRSEGEVATVLGCSVGTVRSQAHRALAKLRAAPELQEMQSFPSPARSHT